MTKINDSFCGYLNIDHDKFTYYVSGNKVSILPAHNDMHKAFESFNNIRLHNNDSPECLFGCDGNNQIAIMKITRFSHSRLGSNLSAAFSTPMIVKANGNASGYYGNLTAKWHEFHAITCYGGNINYVYNPATAVDRSFFKRPSADGITEIKIHPFSDYSHSVDLFVDGEHVVLTISVAQSWNDEEHRDAVSLGDLNSFIRLSFEKTHDIDEILKYYQLIKTLVSILTRQNNIRFDVYLSQKGVDNLLFETAICRIFDNYENYSTRDCDHVISIDSILDCLPCLIEKIINHDTDPLIVLLPDNSIRTNQISITNIQDLCTALEVAYDWEGIKRDKDRLIEELKKKIKETIKEFVNEHSEINVQDETTITSSFQYLSCNLKQKILTLYDENCEMIDWIIEKYNLPLVNKDNVASFVRLRNNKTHSGLVDFSDSVDLYVPLFALVYVCLFKHIGIPNDKILRVLQQIFK